jgi:diphthine-ammonia ligase
MNYVGLVSGGKDSIFNLLWCEAHGHTLVCVANLHPPAPTELDSFMFQTVGVEIVPFIAQSLNVPLLT